MIADGVTDPTVEDLLGQVRSLHQVAGTKEVRGLNKNQLQALDEAICTAIVALADRELPATSSGYLSLAHWIAAIDRSHPVEIFTTNYDVLMEQALEMTGVPFFDGFVGAHRPFFDLASIEQDVLPARWCRLWKLHGSINWELTNRGTVCRKSPVSLAHCRVIHPSHLKYDQSRRMPYLALIDRLRAFMRIPAAVLVVAGYSFRDEHLNEVIVQGLQSNPSVMAFGLMFASLDGYPKAIRLAESRSNLSLLARDAAVVARTRASWRAGEPAEDLSQFAPAISSLVEENSTKLLFDLGDFATLGKYLDGVSGPRAAALQ
jgi:hypothetical protein